MKNANCGCHPNCEQFANPNRYDIILLLLSCLLNENRYHRENQWQKIDTENRQTLLHATVMYDKIMITPNDAFMYGSFEGRRSDSNKEGNQQKIQYRQGTMEYTTRCDTIDIHNNNIIVVPSQSSS